MGTILSLINPEASNLMNAPPPSSPPATASSARSVAGAWASCTSPSTSTRATTSPLKLLLGRAAQDPKSIERFKREARASARIKSENVVKVVDADVASELDGAPFLVMELLNGTDLQKQLERRGRFPPDEALHYLAQAARALDKSHTIGIVHRDIKPENLFLHEREDGSAILKILDFGISKIIGGVAAIDLSGAGMTSTGAVLGTPLYMSPEPARGRIAEIGPTTDVWAMGLILHPASQRRDLLARQHGGGADGSHHLRAPLRSVRALAVDPARGRGLVRALLRPRAEAALSERRRSD